MRLPWIVKDKLVPPRPPADRLRRAWEDAPPPPATFLLAGPGYGKTLALATLAERAAAAGGIVLWYALDADDADPANVFHHVVAGLRAHIPHFGDALTAAVSGGEGDARRLWGLFFEALASYNLPSLLVALDDVHFLFDALPAHAEALLRHLDRLPSGITVALSARKRPPFPLGRRAAQGGLRLLTAEDLRFSPAEIDAFFAARSPGGVPAVWLARADGLAGWPLGLEAVAHDLAARRPDGPLPGSERLAAYLAEEVYLAQPAARQAFMVRAALLDAPTAEACRRVFGSVDAAEHLGALEAEHLVTRGADGHYHFPPHIRDYLREESVRQTEAATRDDWHRAAAAYFTGTGRPELALPHQLASAAWDAAVATCMALFPGMRHDGRHALMARWLSAFPGPVREAEPHLLLWRGHALSRLGEHHEAAALYACAREAFEAARDAAGVFAVRVREANIALLAGETARFLAIAAEIAAREPAGRPEDRADWALIQALDAEQRGDMGAMRRANAAVLQIPVGSNIEIAASHAIAHMNLSTAMLHRGDLALARTHLERLMALAEIWGFIPYRLFGSVLLAHLHLVADDPAGAGSLLRGLPEGWEAVLDWHDRGCSLTVLGHWYERTGDFRAAEEALRRAVAIFEQAGFPEGRKLPLERLAWLALARGEPARAIALLDEAGVSASTPAGSVYDLALVLPQARARQLLGDPGAAARSLAAAAERLGVLEARLLLARCRLLEAAARAEDGDIAAAEAAYRAAGELVAAYGFTFLASQLPAPDGAGTPASERPDLTMRLWGDFEVRVAGAPVTRWPRRKAKAILAALTLYPRGLDLSTLAEVLGEPATEATLKTLKADMTALRRTLEPGLAPGAPSRYVRLEAGRYLLVPETLQACDLHAFEELARQAEPHWERDASMAARAATAAAALLTGALLDEPYLRRYFEPERERVRRRALALLQSLAAFREARGDLAAAQALLEKAIALAPHDEAGYLALLRFHAARGDIQQARQRYWDCRRALKSGLGLAPGAEMEQAYRALSGEVMRA